MLKGVLTRGTARSALSTFARPAAGKTGTQDDNTNAWFVGATPAADHGGVGRRPELVQAR